ncbi:YHS domain-containing (seleno)protein [Puia sp.]|jgi:YHS domain-containing protein|uniref:YHS domain-containing (seleno)protein n=1 Tax=Puia sp. TaxID=2045100 RepID=UPI002F4202FC
MKQLLNLAIAIFLLAGNTIAQQPMHPHAPDCNLNSDGLAIEGYDPVAYFTTGKAVDGNKEYSFTLDGATYRFATAQNRELFKAAPARYRPQYGGWCAFAMGSTGEKVEVDPKTFKIIDGKLFLFYNKFFNNTLKSWNKDEPQLKTKADVNWTKQH